MPFTLSGYASLLALNVSSAGNPESPEPYVTLKLAVVQQPVQAVLEALCGTAADLAALEALHDASDPDRNPRFFALDSIDTGAEYKARHTLTYAGVQVRVAKVSHIKVAPTRGGAWTITCNIGIDQPPPRAIDRWAELLRGRDTRLALDADPELDLKPAKAPAPDAVLATVAAAAKRLRKMAAEDGATITVSAPGRTPGPRA